MLCSHEAAHKAETSRVSFASVSVVMKGNVFAENSLRRELCSEGWSCAKMVAILLTVKPSKIVQFKERRCLAICMQSLGFTEVDFPMATACLKMQLADKYVQSLLQRNLLAFVKPMNPTV